MLPEIPKDVQHWTRVRCAGWDMSGLLAVLIGNVAASFDALTKHGQPNNLTVRDLPTRPKS